MTDTLPNAHWPLIDEIYERCHSNEPNFGVSREAFHDALTASLRRFAASSTDEATAEEIRGFLEQIQHDDLYLAIACAAGSERAWWEFDQRHRSYMERVARHLARTDADARDVVDAVYVELYGTRVVGGKRVSKFSGYSGRGSLRGWLRTVIWHSLVDQHRAGHDEVSLDELTETIGEGAAQANFAEQPTDDGDEAAVNRIVRDQYRSAALNAIHAAFSRLEPHEKLLLLYYHVEELKLREIARLVENESSPLRGWFQRRTPARQTGEAGGRIHESTVMRWLDRCYASVLKHFRDELVRTHGFAEPQIEVCIEIATEDLAAGNLFATFSASTPG